MTTATTTLTEEQVEAIAPALIREVMGKDEEDSPGLDDSPQLHVTGDTTAELLDSLEDKNIYADGTVAGGCRYISATGTIARPREEWQTIGDRATMTIIDTGDHRIVYYS